MYLYRWESGFDSPAGFQPPDGNAAGSPTPNLDSTFVRRLTEATGLEFVPAGAGDCQTSVGPEDILNYMFAILSSPSYRNRYADFLRSDFPRIPLTSDATLLRQLCLLGSRLVALHLSEADDLVPGARFEGIGTNRVETIRYTESVQGGEHRLRVDQQHPVLSRGAPNIWAFHVGGFQVCAKWLKDRKGRQLTYDDLAHYQYIIGALAETIALMREIDELIDANGGWPIG